MLAPVNPSELVVQYFNEEREKARTGNLTIAQLFGAAEKLSAANQHRLAAELYKNWIAFNSGNDAAYMAYFNFGVILRSLNDHEGAINALNECLRLKSDFYQARINLGRAFEDVGHIGKAIENWDQTLSGLFSVNAETLKLKLLTLQQLGRVLEGAEKLEAAENVLKQAMEIRPDKTDAIQHWISLRQRQCKWPAIVPSEHITQRQLIDGMSPMSLALYADDPLLQLAKAWIYNKSLAGHPQLCSLPSREEPQSKPAPTSMRLRIGYVSSDLREHAVGFALVELFELHDKSKFEIFAYSFGESRSADTTHARFRATVDHWADITTLDDETAAHRIAEDKIDILVDLNGYTKHARPAIFARRPAPVIVNWCGYPGTMGSPFHQYMIADEHIIPSEHEMYYSEKILRLHCNQPLDRKRSIASETPSRSAEGLPENAFVYACLNGMQKINSDTLSRWINILREVPDSILWLLSGGHDVDDRLRSAVADQGISPDRIIFAYKRPNGAHLARIALADLFLDTFPYGAHSTAADALTMGVPVLTRPGRSFASRFCASVVYAAGLSGLVCASFDEYVSKAVAIGRDRELARHYREMLFTNREASVLRDMNNAARRLEEIYEEMARAYATNTLPVPDLINLDVYYEIGSELDLERMNLCDDAEYLEAYRSKLAEWDASVRLPADRRV